MLVSNVRFVQGRNKYGYTRKYGLAIHATANTASAANEARYAQTRTDGTSSHFYVDDMEVIQSLDTDDSAGHAGSWQGNQYAIAVEITGLNEWTRQRWLDSVAWEPLRLCLAKVISHHWPAGGFAVRRATPDEMKINPTIRAIYGHDDMRRAWGSTDHTDPGPNFPWDRLLNAIKAALEGNTIMGEWVDTVRLTETSATELFEPNRKSGDEYSAAGLLQLSAIHARRAALASRTTLDANESLRQQVTTLTSAVSALAQKDLVNEQELASALVPLLPSGDLARILRQGMTPDARKALAAELAKE